MVAASAATGERLKLLLGLLQLRASVIGMNRDLRGDRVDVVQVELEERVDRLVLQRLVRRIYEQRARQVVRPVLCGRGAGATQPLPPSTRAPLTLSSFSLKKEQPASPCRRWRRRRRSRRVVVLADVVDAGGALGALSLLILSVKKSNVPESVPGE